MKKTILYFCLLLSGMTVSGEVVTNASKDVANFSSWIMDLAPAKDAGAKKKPAPKAKTGGVSIKHIPADKKVAVSLGGKLFTEYRYGNPTKPILYPVIGPHGIPMTRNPRRLCMG